MSSTLGPPVTGTLANQFRSTFVYGTFNNLDNTSSSIQARAAFQRDVLVGNNLFLGNGAVDASGAFLDSTSNIQYTLNKEIVNFPVTSLRFIKNLTSDVQQQIIDLSNNITNNGGKSSNTVTGLFFNTDSSDVSANAFFQRNVTVAEGLIFGSSINYISASTFDKISYLSTVSSDVQTQISNANTAIANVALKTTDISWSVGVPNQTTIGNKCSTNVLTFSSSLNNITPTVFGYLSGVTSGIQSQISNANTAIANIALKTTDISWSVGAPNTTSIGNKCSTNVLTFSSSLNNISPTVFGYLSGVSSGIQDQINTASTAIAALNSKTIDISWVSGTINRTDIRNACSTSILTFSQSLNSISTTTFSYLSGVTSSIQNQINTLQNQINALINNTPAGMVIAFAGSSSSLSGYLLCDGSYYNSSNYNALFNAIGTIYGDGGNGNFRVPDYRAVFLRGAGQQNVQLEVIGSNVYKSYQSPEMGYTVSYKSTEFTTSAFVDHIHTEVRSVVTGSSDFMAAYEYTNAISSLNFTTNNNTFNFGNQETHPVHTSVQYFIKY